MGKVRDRASWWSSVFFFGMARLLGFFLCLLFFWGQTSHLLAQDSPFPIPFTVRADKKEVYLNQNKIGLFGSARLVTPYFLLEADVILLWVEKTPKGYSLWKWYAQGEVLLYSPPLSLSAEKVWYNHRSEYGEAHAVRLYLYDHLKPKLLEGLKKLNLQRAEKKDKEKRKPSSPQRAVSGKSSQLPPLQLRASFLSFRRLFSEYRSFEGKEVLFSTCTFFPPHYHFRAKRLILHTFPRGRRTLQMESPAFLVKDSPLFWLPKFYWDTDWNPFVPTVRWGNSSRFGTFGLFRWKIPKTPWGKGKVSLDFYQKRGVGMGGEWKLRRPFFLRLEGYTIDDRAEGKEDRNGYIFPKRRRYWTRSLFERRWQRRALLRGEFQRFSDRGVQEEYRERAWKEEKLPETYLYSQYLFPHSALSLEVKVRQNDFYSEIEKLPEMVWEGISLPVELPLLPVLYLDWQSRLGYYRSFRADNMQPDFDLGRFDNWLMVSSPFSVFPFRIEPFGRIRHSYFSRVVSGELERWSASAGVITRLRGFRHYSFGKHVVLFEGMYRNRFWNTKAPVELYPLDETEQIRKGASVPLAMRHYLLFREKASLLRRAELHLYNVYYPRKLYNREIAARSWGFLQLDSAISHGLGPVGLGWSGGGAYNPYDGRIYRGYLGLSLQWNRWWRTSVFFLYRRGVQKNVAFEWQLRWNEKWSFLGYLQVDLEWGRVVQHRLTVRRRLHQWYLLVQWETDQALKDFRVSFNLVPPFFGVAKDPLRSLAPPVRSVAHMPGL